MSNNKGNYGIPAPYDYINGYNGSINPSTVHIQNTALACYYERYLLQKLISRYEFTGRPEEWAENYFLYTLFVFGFVAIIRAPGFGIIPQHCGLRGYNVMYQPTNVVVANPLIVGPMEPRIGTECALIQMQPDYGGAWDIIQFYASMMALCAESAAINLINSKLAYVFISKDKRQAESFKKLFDQIMAGNPAAFADKDLFLEDGSPAWVQFNQDLRSQYIAKDILEDMKTWESKFDTDIGIENVNISKLSGVSADEVNANNISTMSKATLWLETMRKGCRQANNLFGLNLDVKFKDLGGGNVAVNNPNDRELSGNLE